MANFISTGDVYTNLMYTDHLGSNMAVIIYDHEGEAYECTGWKEAAELMAAWLEIEVRRE